MRMIGRLGSRPSVRRIALKGRAISGTAISFEGFGGEPSECTCNWIDSNASAFEGNNAKYWLAVIFSEDNTGDGSRAHKFYECKAIRIVDQLIVGQFVGIMAFDCDAGFLELAGRSHAIDCTSIDKELLFECGADA